MNIRNAFKLGDQSTGREYIGLLKKKEIELFSSDFSVEILHPVLGRKVQGMELLLQLSEYLCTEDDFFSWYVDFELECDVAAA